MTAPQHGKYSTYVNHKCRCADCTAAWARYHAEWRERKKKAGVPESVEHGKRDTYLNYSCRCEPCKAAIAAYQRDYRARRRAVAS